jgi:hypothetical protein
MYASLWRFRGDPDDLMRAFDAITAELPLENFRFHASLRAPDVSLNAPRSTWRCSCL